jgi:uncharacterized membrane protein
VTEVMYGPMQMLVVVFENPEFHGRIRRELESVMEKGIIRLIDLLFLWKDADGNFTALETTQMDEEERMHLGAVMRKLIGFESRGEEEARTGTEEGTLGAAQENYGITEEDVLEITESIPEDTAAAILIIEHLWAKNLKQALRDAGGVLVSQGMLTPELLIAVGEELEEAVKSAEKKKPGSHAAPAV